MIVLCLQCEVTMSSLPDGFAKLSRPTPVPDQLTALLCSRCGAVLPSPNSDDGMLAKLSQLSRFGLGADDRPLLLAEERAN